MDSILDKIRRGVGKINEKSPYYLLGGILLVILIVFFFFPLQFQLASLQQLSPRIKTLTREVETTRNNILRTPQYQKELDRMRGRYEKLQMRIKKKHEIPLLLEKISRLASRNEVRIVEQDLPQMSLNQPILDKPEGQYFSIPIILELRCGYHEFGRFLNDLEREGVFLRLPQMTIEGDPSDPRVSRISLTLEVIIFEEKSSS